MFGTDVPKLIAIIQYELELEQRYLAGEEERVFYDFYELTPEEQERANAKQALEEVRKKTLMNLKLVHSFDHSNLVGATTY